MSNAGNTDKRSNKYRRIAFIASLIEYYDIALYGYLSPILITVFMPELSKKEAFSFFFLIDMLAAFALFAGSIKYGLLGDKEGRKRAMLMPIIGVSVATFVVSMLPSYAVLGVYSTILFIICRCVQNFFLGGEYNGGAIYSMEYLRNKNNHGFVGAIYSICSMFGVLFANFAALIIYHFGDQYFRIAYFIGLLLAIFCYKMRKNLHETPEYQEFKQHPDSIKKPIIPHIWGLCLIILVCLFFNVLYNISTKVVTVFIIYSQAMAPATVTILNIVFILAYMGFLLVFGVLADRVGHTKMMIISTAITAIFAPILILLIPSHMHNFSSVLMIKLGFSILTALLSAPFYAWVYDLFPVYNRYSRVSIGYGLAKCCSTSLIAIMVFSSTHYDSMYIASITIFIIGAILFFALIAYSTYKCRCLKTLEGALI